MSDCRADKFSELIRPHLPMLSRLACRIAGCRSDAEDLLQELLTRLYARAERLENVETLRPWLARALHNLHIDRRRSLARSPHGHLQSCDDPAVDDFSRLQDTTADPGAHTEADRLRKLLEKLVAQLPEEQKIVVILHDVEGYRLEETAGILGVALGTVKSRLFRAHEKLREQLERWNLAPSDFVSHHESPGSQAQWGLAVTKVAGDEL